MNKECSACKKGFTISPDEQAFYELMKASVPNYCPDCRLLRRLVWRNEKTLYRRVCDLCKKNIISIYASDSPYTVYCRECFHGDGWDPLSFGTDFDASRPFLEQFRELQLKVPRLSSFVFQNIASEYVNGAAFNKNCYMCFVSDHNEDSMYSYAAFETRSSSDLLNCSDCDSCYESVTCTKCYQVHYSEDCTNSQNLLFCKNCTNCQDCIGCVNLKNVRYAIFNQPVTKEEYESALAELESREKREGLRKQAHAFHAGFPVKYFHGMRNVQVTGDYVQNSKNSHFVFDSDELEDAKYINHGHQAKTSQDAYVLVDKSERCLEVVSGIALANVLASYCVWHCYDTSYSDTCENSHHLFGCVGLRKKEYAILNKQYTKEQYEALLPKIVADMKVEGTYGEFFPASFSPFAYNETVATEYGTLSKEEATARGFTWREEEKKNYTPTLLSGSIPDTIAEVSDDILKEVIECRHKGECSDRCMTAFRITADELTLYRKLGIPLPTLCFNCRHGARISLRNPRKLWARACMCEATSHAHEGKCPNEFETSYAPERPETIYCEFCYQIEVA